MANVMPSCPECQEDKGDQDFLSYVSSRIASDDVVGQRRFCDFYEKNEILAIEISLSTSLPPGKVTKIKQRIKNGEINNE